MRKTKAFTLIELLIVVVIIGILATFVIIALLGATKKAKDTRAKDAVRTIQSAAEIIVNNDPAQLRSQLGTNVVILTGPTNYTLLKDDSVSPMAQFLKSAPQDATAAGNAQIQAGAAGDGKYVVCAKAIDLAHWWFATSTNNNLNLTASTNTTCPGPS